MLFQLTTTIEEANQAIAQARSAATAKHTQLSPELNFLLNKLGVAVGAAKEGFGEAEQVEKRATSATGAINIIHAFTIYPHLSV